jgi:hypothetical protein
MASSWGRGFRIAPCKDDFGVGVPSYSRKLVKRDISKRDFGLTGTLFFVFKPYLHTNQVRSEGIRSKRD